jgi:hypothetical protein
VILYRGSPGRVLYKWSTGRGPLECVPCRRSPGVGQMEGSSGWNHVKGKPAGDSGWSTGGGTLKGGTGARTQGRYQEGVP